MTVPVLLGLCLFAISMQIVLTHLERRRTRRTLRLVLLGVHAWVTKGSKPYPGQFPSSVHRPTGIVHGVADIAHVEPDFEEMLREEDEIPRSYSMADLAEVAERKRRDEAERRGEGVHPDDVARVALMDLRDSMARHDLRHGPTGSCGKILEIAEPGKSKREA